MLKTIGEIVGLTGLACFLIGFVVLFVGKFIDKTEDLVESLGKPRPKTYGCTVMLVGIGLMLCGAAQVAVVIGIYEMGK
jgi:hypothetical protein